MHRVHADAHYSPHPLSRHRRKRGEVVRDFRARGKLRVVAVVTTLEGDVERCTLCEGAIDRFDRGTFHASARCMACESELNAGA